jgi:hypothetical protein
MFGKEETVPAHRRSHNRILCVQMRKDLYHCAEPVGVELGVLVTSEPVSTGRRTLSFAFTLGVDDMTLLFTPFGAEGTSMYSNLRESRVRVTGPSFVSETPIIAPNRPSTKGYPHTVRSWRVISTDLGSDLADRVLACGQERNYTSALTALFPARALQPNAQLWSASHADHRFMEVGLTPFRCVPKECELRYAEHIPLNVLDRCLPHRAVAVEDA